MSVYKVIDLIGTSPSSWENAAAEAVRRAQQSLNDIRVGEVVEQDLVLDENDAIIYRIKLRLSFKMRPAKPRPDES
jgi:flavin-binding protein dodecin